MKRRFHPQAWKAAGPDLLAFCIGLALAWRFHWQTADLVWSLWLGSLALGYLTILATIAAGLVIGGFILTRPEFPRKYRLPAALAGIALALFFLVFFSFHFCGFHAIHAGFVVLLFPLAGLPPEAFFDGFMNPPRLLAVAFRHVAPLYGAFLLPAVIAERHHVFAALGKALRAVRENQATLDWKPWFTSKAARQQSLQDPFTRPYLNVIRMHLLIFFFGACHVLKIESFLVYAVVYAVYFFPWDAFFPKAQQAAL